MDDDDGVDCFTTVDKYDYDDADAFYAMMAETSNAPPDPVDGEEDAVETVGSWAIEKDYDYKITVNAIDDLCLEQAKTEVPCVLNQILKHVYPASKDGDERLALASNVKHIDMFHVWAGTGSPFAGVFSPFLHSMKRWIEAGIGEEIKMAELFLFIEAELLMCFYKCGPALYYSKTVGDRFSCSIGGISEKRYRNFLGALSTTKQFNVYHSSYEWMAPFNCNDKMVEINDQFRKHCSSIGFVKDVSRIALDDDHVRLRSREVAKCGYTQMNNPAKGQGVVHHAMVGVTTGLYLGGHIPAPGETTSDSVSILQMILAKVNVVRLILLHGILFFWDRGYGGTEGSIHNSTVVNGSDVHSTCQRQNSFPFTFAQAAGKFRTLIQEFGAPVCYWASKEIKTASGTRTQYALAHRNGLKRVVLMSTTLRDCGPGKYAFITKKPCSETPSGDGTVNDTSSSDDETEIESPLERAWRRFEQIYIQQLTSAQRCPEWFLLRQFRITGTCAYQLWRFSKINCEFTKSIKRMIGFRVDDDTSDSDDSDEEDSAKKKRKAQQSKKVVKPKEWNLKVAQLKQLLKDSGRTITGLKGKEALVNAYIAAKEQDRLLEALLSNDDPEKSKDDDDFDDDDEEGGPNNVLLHELMKCWFMAPWKGNRATKIGKENEKNITDHFAAFMEDESDLTINRMKEYGLLANRNNLSAAFSPDGIASFTHPSFDRVYMAVLEMKTHISREELEEEFLLENDYGRYVEVEPEKDPELFKRLIRYKKYRAQVLHGLACSLVNRAFYIVASSTFIIRVVHVTVSNEFLHSYNATMDAELEEANLGWIKTGPIPQFSTIDFQSPKLRYAVNMHTVESTWKLWKEMERMVLERGQPLPEGKFLLPMSIALWNRCKGPIDVYSRYLANVSSRHARLSVTGALWLRLLLTTVFNAYHGYTMCHGYKFLIEECKTYRQYQNFKKKKIHSFAEFVSELCHQFRFYVIHVLGVDGIMLHRQNEEVEQGQHVHQQLLLSHTFDADGSITAPVPPTRFYNKRSAFFEDPALVQKRITNLNLHLKSKVPCAEVTGAIQGRCVWCCENHKAEKKECKVRMGYKTTYMCGICLVPLCVKPRYNNECCYVLFHRAKVLNKPCARPSCTGLVAPDRTRVSKSATLKGSLITPNETTHCEDTENDPDYLMTTTRVSFDNCPTPLLDNGSGKRNRECIGVTPGGRSSSKRLCKK